MVDAGVLNKRISFITETRTQDSEGFSTITRSTFYSCWAQFRQESGKEASKRDGDYSDIEATFLIRYKSGISRKMLIEYDGHDWEITYIDLFEGTKDWLKIRARRAVQAGDTT